MSRVPLLQAEFAAAIRTMFGDLGLAGVTLREVTLAAGPVVTLVYCDDLLERDDLRRLVLDSLPRAGNTAEWLRGCHQQAEEVRTAVSLGELRDGLLDGFIALHADGCAQATLLRAPRPDTAEPRFGHGLRQNRSLLRRTLRSADLRIQTLVTGGGGRACVAYLECVTPPATVQSAAAWVQNLMPVPGKQPLWKPLLDLFRLPATVAFQSPVAAAQELKQGYVLIFADSLPDALIAPPSLQLLLTGPLDYMVSHPMRRVLRWPRSLAAAVALLLGALFAAVTAYHHALLPGPFVAALASQRQNLPFPIIVEILLIQTLDDAMWAAASRIGGRRWGLLATIGTILGGLASYQAGLMGPMSAMLGIVASVAFLLVPNQALAQRLRLWRVLFCLAGIGLGIFGIALLLFVLALYLGQEERFGHPVREIPEEWAACSRT